METHMANAATAAPHEDKPESVHIAKAHDAAERGHVATDRYEGLASH
jgi:hypothetical protein